MSNDIKFIRVTDCTKDELLSANKAYFKALAGTTETSLLSIDDTVIEKTGRPKKMEGLGWHYSHSKGSVVYGRCLVSGQYRTGALSLPCDFESYVTEKAARKQGDAVQDEDRASRRAHQTVHATVI